MTTRVHRVKSWKAFYQAIQAGEKKHDLRENDRNFEIGDHLILEEYDPFEGAYTGERVLAKITYITSRVQPCAFSSAVLHRDYCILSLETVDALPLDAVEIDPNPPSILADLPFMTSEEGEAAPPVRSWLPDFSVRTPTLNTQAA